MCKTVGNEHEGHKGKREGILVAVGSLRWSRSAEMSEPMGWMLLRSSESSEVSMYSDLECSMSGSVSTSSSRFDMTSSYAAMTGMARSITASIIACTIMLASQLRRIIVSCESRRLRMGALNVVGPSARKTK